MVRSRVIPCLLLRDGGLVKTTRFRSPKYVGDPINAVKIFNEKKVDELCIYDIGKTVDSSAPDFSLLEAIAIESRMPLCYGGGIASSDDAAQIIALGFEKVSVSHAALLRPQFIAEMADRIGSQSVVVTVDVKKQRFGRGYSVYSHNGRKKHAVDLCEFVSECARLGAGEIVVNSIDMDGTMEGYDMRLAEDVRRAVSTPMTVLGGAGSLEDIRLLCDQLGPIGAGVGSFFVFKGKYRAVLLSYVRPN